MVYIFRLLRLESHHRKSRGNKRKKESCRGLASRLGYVEKAVAELKAMTAMRADDDKAKAK